MLAAAAQNMITSSNSKFTSPVMYALLLLSTFLFQSCHSLQCYLCGVENRVVGGLDTSRILDIYPCPEPFNATDIRITKCNGACRKFSISYDNKVDKVIRKCVPKCTTHNKVTEDPKLELKIECCTSDLCNAGNRLQSTSILHWSNLLPSSPFYIVDSLLSLHNTQVLTLLTIFYYITQKKL